MPRRLIAFPAALLLVSIAACAPEDQSWSEPPVSSAPGLGSQAPQPPGSLPPGAAVNAPIVPPGGELLRMGSPAERGY